VRAELDVQAAHVRTDLFTNRDSPTLSCPHNGPDLHLLIPIANATHGRADWAFRASVGLGPAPTWTSPGVLAGRWRCPLAPFAASALPAICAGLTLAASSGGAPLRLPDALRRTMGNALIGTLDQQRPCTSAVKRRNQDQTAGDGRS
jgi:hypothetical protein